MIAKLRGLVDTVDADSAIIDVGGVGYLVYCSGRTLGGMRAGESVVLLTDMHVREDDIRLHGFQNEGERDWFRLLNTVQGVGTKAALGILGVFDGDQLLTAILAEDVAMIRRAPGVGPKLAARIVNELRSKVGGLALGTPGRSAAQMRDGVRGAPSATSDAISALVNLGYGASEAMRAVAAVGKELGETATVEQLIRGGLSELAPKDLRA